MYRFLGLITIILGAGTFAVAQERSPRPTQRAVTPAQINGLYKYYATTFAFSRWATTN
jgi:hypothetical protein